MVIAGSPLEADRHVSESMSGGRRTRKSSSLVVMDKHKDISQVSKDAVAIRTSVDGLSVSGTTKTGKRKQGKKKKRCRGPGDCCEDNGLESGAGRLVSCETVAIKNCDGAIKTSSLSELMEPKNMSRLSKVKDALVNSANGVSLAESPERVKRRHARKQKSCIPATTNVCRDDSLEPGGRHLVSHETIRREVPENADLQEFKAKIGDQTSRRPSSSMDLVEELRDLLSLRKDGSALVASLNGSLVAKSPKGVKQRRARKRRKCISEGDCCRDDGLKSGSESLVSHQNVNLECPLKAGSQVPIAESSDQTIAKSASLSKDEDVLAPPVNGVPMAASPKRVKRRLDRRRKNSTSAGDCLGDPGLESGAEHLVSHEIMQQDSSLEGNLQESEANSGGQMMMKSFSSDRMEEPQNISLGLDKEEDTLAGSVSGISVAESPKRVKRRGRKKRKRCGSVGYCCGDDSLESKCLVSRETIGRQSSQEALQAEVSMGKLLPGELVSLPAISTQNIFQQFLSSVPPKLPAKCSRKKLLILDINGLLADIVRPAPKWVRADGNFRGRAIFRRPFCSDFLNFCMERFDVAIWSSRSKTMVDKIVQILLGDLKEKLIFCWDLSQCAQSKVNTLENRHKPVVFKELRRIWEKTDPRVQWEKGYYNASNTLLVDDSPYKALLNPPNTALFPVSYSFKDRRIDDSIGPGGDIRTYLEELALAENVQEYIRSHPFGQSAITKESLTWPFYEKAIMKQRVANLENQTWSNPNGLPSARMNALNLHNLARKTGLLSSRWEFEYAQKPQDVFFCEL
ncbi:hypothetical protein AKJ16_DCAP01844 [Drosera capensis]